MRTKVKEITWSDFIHQMIISVALCSLLYAYLNETLIWYKALYLSGIVFWFAMGILTAVQLLHNIIDAVNKGD